MIVVKSFKTNPAALRRSASSSSRCSLDNVVDVDADNVVVTLGASTAAGPRVRHDGLGERQHAGGRRPRQQHAVRRDARRARRPTTASRSTSMSNPKGFPGPFSLPVTIQFDNPNGGRITSVQSVGLMFTRNLVFDVGALSYPRERHGRARRSSVSVSVKNTNDFTINGVALVVRRHRHRLGLARDDGRHARAGATRQARGARASPRSPACSR